MKTENKEHKIALILPQDKHFISKLSLLLIILSDTKTALTWGQNTAVLRVCKFYVAIYYTIIYSVKSNHCKKNIKKDLVCLM